MADTKIIVTNISPLANEKTITDFFSFCGKIEKLTLNKSPDGVQPQTCELTFETPAAAKTSLLLSNALILDFPIHVAAYQPPAETQPSETPAPAEGAAIVLTADQIQQRPFDAADEDRSKTSVIASLVAAGYVLASDSLAKAKEYDENYHIRDTITQAVTDLKTKAVAVDSQYRITERMNNLTVAAVAVSQQIDDKYHIQEKVKSANSIVDTVSKTVSQTINLAADAAGAVLGELAKKAMENETVAKGVATLKNAGTALETTAVSIQSESLKLIEEEKRKRGQSTTAAPAPEQTATEMTPLLSATEAPVATETTTPTPTTTTTPTVPPQ